MSFERTSDALLLEGFDIKKLSKLYPYKEIGVNTNRIYIQIAKFSHNSQKRKELLILKKTLSKIDNEENNYIDPKYASMTLCEVMQCFGTYLKKMPKTTFIQLYTFD